MKTLEKKELKNVKGGWNRLECKAIGFNQTGCFYMSSSGTCPAGQITYCQSVYDWFGKAKFQECTCENEQDSGSLPWF